MKKIKFFATCSLALLAFATCKKQAPPATSPVSTSSNLESLIAKPYQQKAYNLDIKQTVDAIKKFKNTCSLHSSQNIQAKGIAITDSVISLDSAIYVLEATLNIDFDRGKVQGNQPGTSPDSVSYPTTIPIGTNADGTATIKTADLINAYNFIAEYLKSITHGPDKIKVVDVVASLTSSGLNINTGIVVLTFGRPAYPYIPNCGPIVNNAAWSTMFGCSGNPVDGPTICQNVLNCQNINGHGCYGGYVWYTDVLAGNFSGNGNAYPTALYWKSTGALCDPTVLNPGQLSSYSTNLQALAIANIPFWGGPPPTRSISNVNISAGFIGFMGGCNNWWYSTITYGRAFCSLQVL